MSEIALKRTAKASENRLNPKKEKIIFQPSIQVQAVSFRVSVDSKSLWHTIIFPKMLGGFRFSCHLHFDRRAMRSRPKHETCASGISSILFSLLPLPPPA